MPSPNPLPVSVKIILVILSVLVLISLGLNIYLVQQWSQAKTRLTHLGQNIQPLLTQTFETVDSELANFQQSTLEFNVRVNQQVPLQTKLPFSETIKFPVQVTIPISHEIKTTVMVDPFGSGFTFPMEVNVPINMKFPIDEVVSVAISRTIPISTSVPLSLTLPINLPISGTNLAPTIERLRTGATDFSEQLHQTLTGVE